MRKSDLKKITFSIIISFAGAVFAIGTPFISIKNITVELPLLIIGMLAVFQIFNFLVYKRATTGQIVTLSNASILFFIGTMFISLIGQSLTGVRPFIFSSTLPISPVMIVINLLTSIISVRLFFQFDLLKPVKRNNFYKPDQKTTISTDLKIPANTLYTEHKSVDNNINIIENKENKPEPPEQIEKQNNDEDEDEIVVNYNFEIISGNNKTENKEIFEENNTLGNLPEIDLDETENSLANKYIPENVRLVENITPKKAVESGKISSIGKLLINHKDLENIIEINEAIQQIENETDSSNIITKILGEKLKESLKQIESSNPQIKNSTIANKAGFTVASLIIDDKHEQTVGSLTSGAFLTIQNYISRLGIENPSKIFFITDNGTHMLFKVDNFIFYFNSDEEFEPINYTSLKDIIDQRMFTHQDIDHVRNINGIIKAVISDRDGNIIGQNNDNNLKKLASVTTAIFENLKIFIMNIENVRLDRIIIFSDDKIVTIKKYNNLIASFLSTPETSIILTDGILKIEKLIK